MSLGLNFNISPFSYHHAIRPTSFPAHKFPKSKSPATTVRCSVDSSTLQKKSIGRIRERITSGKVEISPSAYDTAWVAMVPAREYSGEKPYFPECLDWIIQNQNPDGSWGMDPGHPSLVKDSLSCTLACLLALRKWNVGHQQVNKGLEFIRANRWAVGDKDQFSPIGFEFIFPTMVNYANELELTLPFDQDVLDCMVQSRDSQINSERIYKNLGYVAEGVGESFNWKDTLLTQQRSNGSLFNSPATTAAALIHSQGNNKCYEYLQSLLESFKNCGPTIYPLDIYTRLRLVDTIQELGIDRFFQSEIDAILEQTYVLWQHKEEEIFTDVNCCAVAFRLLRIKGFEVLSDELAPFAEQDQVSLKTTGVSTILELYRASQFRIHEEETTLDAINDWTTKFLKQQLLSKNILDNKLQKQVEYELKNFRGILDRVGNRQSLDLYEADNYEIMKAAYRCDTIYNEDILRFSRQDFNICQTQYQKELEEIKSWYKGFRLDMDYGRDVSQVGHFLASAIFGDPQLSDARLSYAKTVILVTRMDDFIDHHGSIEEAYEILELVKEWKEKPSEEYGSKEVEILFTAIYHTVNELADKAYVEQGRCVKHLLIGVWIQFLTLAAKERDSWSEDATMTLEEYLSFTWVTIGCRICALTPIYFLGIKLSDDMVLSQECTSLCIHLSTVVRLLNDLQTFQKEQNEKTINSMHILIKEAQKNHKNEEAAKEEAVSKMQKMIEYNWRKTLAMVYQRKSVLPRECKDVLFATCKTGYYLYNSSDEFTTPQQMKEDMTSLIHQPLQLPPITSNI